MMTDQRRQIGRRPASSTRQRFAHGRPRSCHLSLFTFHTSVGVLRKVRIAHA
jgi:hypothetical protein